MLLARFWTYLEYVKANTVFYMLDVFFEFIDRCDYAELNFMISVI
jgi:hypothetical protein